MKPPCYVLAGTAGVVLALGLYITLPRKSANTGTPSYPAPASRAAPASLQADATATPEAGTSYKIDLTPATADPLAELKRRLDDPQQRAAHLARARLNVEQASGRLFQRLRHYSPEVLDRLKTALAEKQLAIERAALHDHLPGGDFDAVAGKERLDRIQQEADEQIRTTFGDEIYAQYTYAQQSEPLRGSIQQVTNVLRSRGIDVTDEMQEGILAGYTSALVAAAKLSANDTTPAAFQSLSVAARREFKAKQQARFDEILASTMSKILGPDEYKLFMESEFVQGAGSP
jgi:hypothetical protein